MDNMSTAVYSNKSSLSTTAKSCCCSYEEYTRYYIGCTTWKVSDCAPGSCGLSRLLGKWTVSTDVYLDQGLGVVKRDGKLFQQCFVKREEFPSCEKLSGETKTPLMRKPLMRENDAE
eukprot:TRINITY_DN34219_c0_g1_i1.p1 TRINITY_DN34219_c0_g1~~TRINITY_DN34219_c0_g1_i1.p1  ORF type:complete len:117 (-),score=9.45 TRINITY_DN34219_c0_g1_i1:29-379(-)